MVASRTGRKSRVRYFYLDGDLHQTLHVHRGQDRIIMWNYPQAKRVVSSYSYTLKHRQPAFTMKEVCKMLNRGRLTLEHAILDGNIESPQYTYTLNENRRKIRYMFSEENILDAHAYLSTVHRGRPRKDGLVTPMYLPTVRELKAMIRNEPVLYVQDDNGDFRPVWQAPDFSK